MTITAKTDGGQVWLDGYISHPLLRDGGFTKMRFLVDTGATSTTLLQGAVKELKVDFASLKRYYGLAGIGGPQEAYVMENASFVFFDREFDPIFLSTDMYVLKPDPKIALPPSFALLGIDLLRRFRFEYDLPYATLDLKRAED